MAVSMRLKKVGRKNSPSYRLVVADSRSPRDGKFIEELGWYNSYKEKPEEKSKFNEERVKYWLSKGVIVSPTVKKLLKINGITLTIKV